MSVEHRYYGWAAQADPMFPGRITGWIDATYDTADELVRWWEVTVALWEGRLWWGEALYIREGTHHYVQHRVRGRGVGKCVNEIDDIPKPVANTIARYEAETEGLPVPPLPADPTHDPARDLWSRVLEVKDRVGAEAREARAARVEQEATTPDTCGEPVCRVAVHTRHAGCMLAGSVPPNVWDRDMMGFPHVDDGPAGRGVIIAVLDTGCNRSHPTFAGATVMPVIDATGHGDAIDANGHGTFVCSQIVGQGGTTRPFGMAPRASIVPIRVLHPRDGWGTDSQIARGVDAAVDVGADIISMSLGGPDPVPLTEAALRRASIGGVIVVCAAGNDGPGPSDVSYPGRSIHVTCVGSVSASKGISGFSNRGPSLEIMAAGEQQIGATGADTYGRWSGTSMATPHVASAYARWLRLYRDLAQLAEDGQECEATHWDESSHQTREWSRGGRMVGIVHSDDAIAAIRIDPPADPPDPPTVPGHVVLEVSEQVYQWLQLTGERFSAGPRLTIKKGPPWDGKS